MQLTIRLSSFKDFIIDIKNKWDTCKNDLDYKPMIDWIRDDDNNILTNKIVKFENLLKFYENYELKFMFCKEFIL